MNVTFYHLLLIFDKLGVKQQERTFGGHGKVLYLECGHDYKIEISKNASHYKKVHFVVYKWYFNKNFLIEKWSNK